MPSWKTLLAVVGGVILLASLFLFDWYGVGEGKIAPLRIDATLLAQRDLGAPSPQPPQPPQLPPEADIAQPPQGDVGAWDGQGALGTLGNLVLLIAALWAIGAAAPLASARLARAFSIVTAGLGAAALAVVVVRMAFPVEDVDGYEFEATLEFGIFAAAGAALLIVIGGLLGVRDAAAGRNTGKEGVSRPD